LIITAGTIPIFWWGIGASVTLFLLILILIVLLFLRMKRFERAYQSLKTYMSGQDLEGMLGEYIQRVHNQEEKLEQCSARLDPIELKLKASVDRGHLHRYKAFENVGSDLSFALALTNQDGDGFVLNSIHNREESRVYAKPLIKGESTYLLTEEEKTAISKAMIGPKI
jgi:hypothetical protein